MLNLTNFILNLLNEKISNSFRILLEEKHLYQSVKIEKPDILDIIEKNDWSNFGFMQNFGIFEIAKFKMAIKQSDNKIASLDLNKFFNSIWVLRTFSKFDNLEQMEDIFNIDDVNVHISLPTIKIKCNKCNSVTPPHNPGIDNKQMEINHLDLTSYNEKKKTTIQVFSIPYQCQSCKKEPIIFQIYRTDKKLTLSGRSQFEKVDIPNYIPTDEQNYYSDAVIAFNSGRILAALFYLRVLIEHYMRRVTQNMNNKITGEDLGDQYSKLIDEEFPNKFTSLKKVYEELSIKIHSFDEDTNKFSESLQDIEKHFDILQHFPLGSKNK